MKTNVAKIVLVFILGICALPVCAQSSSDQMLLIASKLGKQASEIGGIVTLLSQHAQQTKNGEERLSVVLAGARLAHIGSIFSLEADLIGSSQHIKESEKARYYKYRVAQMRRSRNLISILSKDVVGVRDFTKGREVQALLTQGLENMKAGVDLLELGAVGLSAHTAR